MKLEESNNSKIKSASIIPQEPASIQETSVFFIMISLCRNKLNCISQADTEKSRIENAI